MGVVYAAYDRRLDRQVAIKVLLRPMNDRARARVVREAKAMAQVKHGNVVQVYDVGEHEGELYVAMEFVEGASLAKWQATWPSTASC